MAKRFELIVFDWDGTLLDSAAAIVRAIQAASADLGLPVPTDARARHVIGLGLWMRCITPCRTGRRRIIRRWSSVTATIICQRS
jgi:phosphoglycolate phosphatase-like HAD superfamily hydrolase